MDVRKLVVGDLQQARDLSVEAFGGWPAGVTPPPLPTELPAGRHTWGAFDGEHLVAKADAHEYESWWHGVRVPTAGIAGVAVAAEHRGGGLLRTVFEPLLAEAVARGEVLSTLFPTATGIYRPLGYELVTSYDTVEVPTAELTRVAPALRTTTRRAEPSDDSAVREVYRAWAAAQNGPLTRTGPLFDLGGALTGTRRVTLALDEAERPVGVAVWDREGGYGPQGVLRVHDLLATTADGYRALWRMAASFASVTGTVRLSTSGSDPARLVLPLMTWDVVGRHPYLLRVLDVAGAVEALALALPGGGGATVDLAVAGDRLAMIDGTYRLTLGDGPGRCEQVTTTTSAGDVPVLTPQGLALVYAGAQSCGNLRMLGHLTGPTTHDAVLDAVLGGRQVHVRDYF